MAFKKPVSSPVSQNFAADFKLADGRWYYKQTLGYGGHNGVDYAAPMGTPVYAADDGVVVFEGWGQNHSWMGAPAGICVVLNHGESHSGYAHLSSTVVNRGQRVVKGQLLGYSGNTGAATGPHLHFEMLPKTPNFSNGFAGRIDPSPYMEQAKSPQGDSTVDRIKSMYLRLTGRDADQDGINHYTRQVSSNGWGFVYDDLKNSGEGQADWRRRNPARVKELEVAASKSASLQAEVNQLKSKNSELASTVTDNRNALAAANSEITRLKAETERLKLTQGGGLDAQTKATIESTGAGVNWLVEAIKSIFNRK